MRLALALVIVPWSAACLAMLLAFESWRGRLAAWWCVGLLALCLSLAGGRLARAQRIAVVLLIAFLGLVAASPMVRRNDLSVGLHRPQGRHWVRFHPMNIVPEGDLACLGVRLLYPRERSGQVLATFQPLYREMSRDSRFASLPTLVPSTAADLLGIRQDQSYYFYALPQGQGPFPTLVFLHGAMGNFQSFLYFWQRWAEPRGWAVVCPSFGYGSWYAPGGQEAACAAVDDALRRLPLDSGRMVLSGLSNGATGAVRLVRARPTLFQRLLLVSPVIEVKQFDSPEFREWFAHHPAPLVLEGDQDVNVTPADVAQRLGRLREKGLRFDFQSVAGHDHHMMFSAPQTVYQALDQLVGSDTP